jgi:hypothetical protein
VWLCVVVGCAATKKQTNLQVKKIVDRMWDRFTNVSDSQKFGFFSTPHLLFLMFQTFVLMTQCMFFVAIPHSLSIPKIYMFDGKSKSIDLCQKKERQRILALERVLFQNTSYGSDRQWRLCGGMSCGYWRHHLSIW